MKIVAISGGKVPAGNSIDREIVHLSGKSRPKALFIPTASEYPGSSSVNSEANYRLFQESFEETLGCKTDVLYLVKKEPSVKEIREKILGSDIVYVGGGSPLKMLKVWRKLGVDKVLEEAMKRDIVLSGISAGANCWFQYGQSNETRQGVLTNVRGLGFLPSMFCPHYDNQANRRPALIERIRKNGGSSLALDTFSAIEVVGNEYRILTCSETAQAYKVYRRKGEVVEEELPKDGKFRSLTELFNR